jgi:signal recognition particle subunit SRP68
VSYIEVHSRIYNLSCSDLHLLLFSAERALAHSHTLKAVHATSDAGPNSRRDQLSWLRRALAFSTLLYDISSSLAAASPSRLSQQTFAEITIYHLSLRSELGFEKSQWAETLTDLATRRTLLSTLSDSATDSYDQALAIEFIDQYDPLIRFCAYKLGRAESHDIEGVVSDIDAEMMEEALPGMSALLEGLRRETKVREMEAGRRTLEDVTFAGEKVELRNAEIVRVMLKVQEALGKLEKKGQDGRGRGMKGWDNVLAVLGEAESVAKHLLDDHEVGTRLAFLASYTHGL